MSVNLQPASETPPRLSADPELNVLLHRLATYFPRGIDPNLDRTFRLLRDLGNPQRELPPAIHIAGTNGKGSTLATIRAISEAAGMSCHVMTSPHLVNFNERIVVAGREIETPALISVLEEAERLNAGRPTTSFELTTAAGLLEFSRHAADLCLLETGMGGRLDATNVVEEPLLTLITVISYDHMQYLGTTLREIAGEKAAIMKRGTPCVIGPQTPEGLRGGVMDVFTDTAERLNAPLYRHGHEWSYEPSRSGFILHTPTDTYEFPRPNLLGEHQVGNAATALMGLLCIQDRLPKPLPLSAIESGLKHIRWPARLQRLTTGKLPELLPEGWELWLDGGHNDTGGDVLAVQAAAWRDEAEAKPLHLIAGMLNTKDPCAFLRPLTPFLASAHSLAVPDQPLSLSAPDLAGKAAEGLGFTMLPAHGAAEAVAKILKNGGKPGRILIAGSLYLAGTILSENN